VESLKEWATVVKALENGDQTVILRKGGILEIASGFKVEAKKFLLFPTFEHQEFHHIKPEFHKYLEQVKSKQPKEGFKDEADVSSDEKINALSKFHIWSDSYIKERKNWKPEKPLKAVFLRVFKIPQKEIPLKSEYQGCKSWININDQGLDGESVLSDEKINLKLKEFKEIVN
jgi:hypothetical protein